MFSLRQTRCVAQSCDFDSQVVEARDDLLQIPGTYGSRSAIASSIN